MDATPAIAEWAGPIPPHLVSAAESIIAAGRELLAAKASLPHGQFGPLLDDLGLNRRTAQRFTAVARHPVLSDPTHGSHLPGAWGTLYELSRLPGDVVEAALESGFVTPSTQREDVQALRDGSTVDPRLAAKQHAIADLECAVRVAEKPGVLTTEQAVEVFTQIHPTSGPRR